MRIFMSQADVFAACMNLPPFSSLSNEMIRIALVVCTGVIVRKMIIFLCATMLK